MIVKLHCRDESSAIGNPGWVYVDRIAKVKTHGYVLPDGDERMSCTRDELRRWVEENWGTERDFADELWPEYQDAQEQRTVVCCRLQRDDGEAVLLLADDTTFLMSDDGKTIDRLR